MICRIIHISATKKISLKKISVPALAVNCIGTQPYLKFYFSYSKFSLEIPSFFTIGTFFSIWWFNLIERFSKDITGMSVWNSVMAPAILAPAFYFHAMRHSAAVSLIKWERREPSAASLCVHPRMISLFSVTVCRGWELDFIMIDYIWLYTDVMS